MCCCMQYMGAGLRRQFPHFTRWLQTVLHHPTAVQLLGSRLEPPEKPYVYRKEGPNPWGEGPGPLAPLEQFTKQNWSGGLSSPASSMF